MSGGITNAAGGHACNCIGPQNGEPLCPCMMRGVTERGGRWVRNEQDLGPIAPTFKPVTLGCVCPAGSEITCKGPLCPRRAIGGAK